MYVSLLQSKLPVDTSIQTKGQGHAFFLGGVEGGGVGGIQPLGKVFHIHRRTNNTFSYLLYCYPLLWVFQKGQSQSPYSEIQKTAIIFS